MLKTDNRQIKHQLNQIPLPWLREALHKVEVDKIEQALITDRASNSKFNFPSIRSKKQNKCRPSR